jgi:hypothetical protein
LFQAWRTVSIGALDGVVGYKGYSFFRMCARPWTVARHLRATRSIIAPAACRTGEVPDDVAALMINDGMTPVAV